jgi:hypothetical protein
MKRNLRPLHVQLGTHCTRHRCFRNGNEDDTFTTTDRAVSRPLLDCA